jgi:hypothetical protein
MKRHILGFVFILSAFALLGCASTTTAAATVVTTLPTYDEEDEQDIVDVADGMSIVFSADAVTLLDADGTVLSTASAGSTVLIDDAGVYVVTGTGSGSIVVDADSEDTVTLVLSGCDITSTDGPAIDAEQSDKLIVNLAADTTNVLSDSASSDSDIHSTLFSNDDITINGTGSLTINAHVGNGINTDDDLVITNGTISIDAENDGLKANDAITIKVATVSIVAGNDAIHCENSSDTSLGNVTVESGTFTLSAYGDGIDASGILTVLDGDLTVTSGVNNMSIATVSGKGLKATRSVGIAGGTFAVVSKDDAVHSNGSVVIAGGDLTISSSDDGIHADEVLSVQGGTIDIVKCYEGLESLALTISGGTIHIDASDDGVNGAGGVDSSGTFPWGGQGGMTSTGTATLAITGGYLFVDADGDGIDINGSMSMSGGTVIVNGPTSSGDGALDYDSGFKMTGGFLIAAGSTGMAMNVGSTSTQYGVMITLSSASTKMIRIVDGDGEEVVSFAPSKNVQSIVVSLPSLSKNVTYSVYVGGTVASADSSLDGVTSGGTYSGGTLYKTFSITAITTSVGATSTIRK